MIIWEVLIVDLDGICHGECHVPCLSIRELPTRDHFLLLYIPSSTYTPFLLFPFSPYIRHPSTAHTHAMASTQLTDWILPEPEIHRHRCI